MGGGVNNHIQHSTPTQSCKEDFMTKTNSKIEVLFRNIMLLTGVPKLPAPVSIPCSPAVGFIQPYTQFFPGVKWLVSST